MGLLVGVPGPAGVTDKISGVRPFTQGRPHSLLQPANTDVFVVAGFARDDFYAAWCDAEILR